MKRLVALNVFFILFPFILYSQSGHYWTQQYGTKSILLGNSVIGGVEDLGAVYYNPARLGFIENPAFLLSADVYQLSRIKIENVTDTAVDLSKSSFNGVPSLAAGSFRLKALPNHNFAYAILTRQSLDLSFAYREERIGDILTGWPGDEIFEGEINFATNNKVDWFGGSWAHALNDKISLGLSTFFSVNDQSKGLNTELRALADDGAVATYLLGKNYSFKTYSLIWKLAAAFSLKNIDLGITFTTPTLDLSGKSDYSYQFYLSDTEGLAENENTYANSYQSDIDVSTKTPLSIGAGITYNVGKNKVHLSAEYYGKVDNYTLFSADDHAVQSNPDSIISFRVVDKLNDVINAGIGVEWYLNEKLSAFGSFSTDFSAAASNITTFTENSVEAFNTSIKADYYHFGAGFVLDLRRVDVTLGATYTGAKEEFPRPISFPGEVGDQSEIYDPEDMAELKWSRWRFVFSFSVPFFKELSE